MRVSADVDDRTLREIYLPAFERVVTEAAPATVMCAYNRINGVYASENPWLLTDLLRDEWGFNGAVVSDWGAVNDRVAARRGRPGPGDARPSGGGDRRAGRRRRPRRPAGRGRRRRRASDGVLALAADALAAQPPTGSTSTPTTRSPASSPRECVVLLRNERRRPAPARPASASPSSASSPPAAVPGRRQLARQRHPGRATPWTPSRRSAPSTD